MTARTPSLGEVINKSRESLLQDLRVALPARVESYDSARQLVNVKPLVGDIFEQEDGSLQQVSLPVISNVPVAFPGGGGMRITFPIQAGDTVLLVFADRSLDAWLDQGGESNPVDERRHTLSDAIAIPGLHPNNKAWSGAEAGVVTLGSDSGAADFVALAQKVTDQLTALKSAINGWTPVPNDGGAALKAALSALFASWPQPVASSTVKIKG